MLTEPPEIVEFAESFRIWFPPPPAIVEVKEFRIIWLDPPPIVEVLDESI